MNKIQKPHYIFQGILSVVSVYILLKIYEYLNTLEHCPCFVEENDNKYGADITFMKFYQFLEIFSLLIFIVLMFFIKFNNKKGGSNNMLKLMFVLSLSIMLFISGYMSYNVLSFYSNLKNDCECANKWQKYFIYVEGLTNSIYFLRLFYLFIFIIMISIFNFFK